MNEVIKYSDEDILFAERGFISDLCNKAEKEKDESRYKRVVTTILDVMDFVNTIIGE